jgi:hypothetical protein
MNLIKAREGNVSRAASRLHLKCLAGVVRSWRDVDFRFGASVSFQLKQLVRATYFLLAPPQ